MAAVTIYSDFGAPLQIKSVTVSTLSPFICHEVMGSDAMILVFWMAGSSKKQESSRKTSISALLTMPKPSTVWITINWKILKEMGVPDHLICLFRNLYADQEATVRTGHGTTDWFQLGKEYVKLYIVTLLIQLIWRAHHVKCWTG